MKLHCALRLGEDPGHVCRQAALRFLAEKSDLIRKMLGQVERL